jgi:hypothetical protein
MSVPLIARAARNLAYGPLENRTIINEIPGVTISFPSKKFNSIYSSGYLTVANVGGSSAKYSTNCASFLNQKYNAVNHLHLWDTMCKREVGEHVSPMQARGGVALS